MSEPQTINDVRQVLAQLIPASLVNIVPCFVFYDNHPRDERNLDVTVCTIHGEVKEFYKRELVSSTSTFCERGPTEIRIVRNSKCELFYLVVTGDQLCIFSRKDKLRLHQKVCKVESYIIDDQECCGQIRMTLRIKGAAAPLVYDDKFECSSEHLILKDSIHAEESIPVLIQLNRKLAAARYNTKCNETAHKNFVNLRQLATYSTYQKLHPNNNDSAFNAGPMEMSGEVELGSVWVKSCNKKIVIGIRVINKTNLEVDDVHMLLHGHTRPSMVYAIKLFERTSIPPYWIIKKTQTLELDQETAVVAVIDYEEIKNNILSKIEFNGVLVYKKTDEEHLLPFGNVIVSALDMMGENFDVLSTDKLDDYFTILSVLATTEKKDLLFRHIKLWTEPDLEMSEMFCIFMGMEQIPKTKNILIYRKSPYHALNGTMVIFDEEKVGIDTVSASVYTRTPSQILSLIHYISECVPYRIIITTPHQKIIARTSSNLKYNEIISPLPKTHLNHIDYARSIVNRVLMILDFLDNCLIKMNITVNPVVRSKIGVEIDLFVEGVMSYLQFRYSMLAEELKGIKFVNVDDSSNKSNIELEDIKEPLD